MIRYKTKLTQEEEETKRVSIDYSPNTSGDDSLIHWIFKYYLQYERPCCIRYTNSSRRRETIVQYNTDVKGCKRSFPLKILKALSHEAIFSCNLQRNGVSSCLLQERSPPAGHTTTCIRLQFYRSLKYLFHPNLRSKLQEKIASCDSTFR